MKLSTLLVIIPLASALPQAPAVDVHALEARDACGDARDDCLVKCRPTGLAYIYCVSSCFTKALWCKADD
ncbi:uncharacterized protein TRIVIDRAFT_223913 [Trichoderma virens Gv29-8]|uniref:Uncharacterized protein n=1 Tax=Hypocrea virens (strain Gv29-8 / FGSC 10586) TaxID=413071 RepID=G9MYH8_HYPVG|nr:uncharacterized protein TRIVIDRAFT_223913 [Trichoderma virens Gv29-8]EHK20598.1 hypothetical protein TRIVIDRAFT_223913 [Trichoderma virens Gv29-8]UKZ53058.1 hypothetical protein TrVGV298_006845 [Trichoderma virens]UKZ78896.1 hypothetical protein TrVFT333_006642 [Trichoderma virens FT-333]